MNIVPITDPPFDCDVAVTCRGVEIGTRGTYDVDIALAERFGLFECVGLGLRGQGHQRVDGDVLRRVRVAELVREVSDWLERTGIAQTMALSVTNEGTPPDTVDGVPWALVDESVKAWHERTIATPAKNAGRRYEQMIREAAKAGGLTRLLAAADIYKRAARRRRPATKAVADELGITYNAAAGLVRRCREADPPLLPPRPGRGRGGAAAIVGAQARRKK